MVPNESGSTPRPLVAAVELVFERDRWVGALAQIVATDPMDGGAIWLTPECRQVEELRYHVAQLKKRLDDVVAAAEQQFAQRNR